MIRTTERLRRTARITPTALVLARFITAATQTWTSRALCTQTDPDLFFSDSVSQLEQAKAVCRQCPVREECLSHAVEKREEFGVWGGLDRDERRRLLRRGRSRTTPPHARDTA